MQFSRSQKTKILILNLLLPFLLGTGIDLYVPSLPAIARYYHASDYLVQLTISLYLLGYGIGQLFLGVLSDSYGRKRILMISTVCFTVVSFLASFSPNIYMLNLYRLLQGLSIGSFGSIGRAIAIDCFSGISLTKTMSYISTSWSLGPILGPFIGGYFQQYFSWQTDFYFFSLYGVFVFIYMAAAIPETNQNIMPLRPKKTLRMIKTVLIHPYFLLITIMLSIVYAAIVLFNVIGPFLIQDTLKYSALDYGHIALLLGLGYFLGNTMNRFMIVHFDTMKIVLFAMISACFMSVVMVILGFLMKINLLIIILPTFFLFYFCGFTFPNLMGKTIGLFPKTAGTASALFGSLVIAGVFLVTIFATLLKTDTQMPLAITYAVMIFASFILFFISKRFDKEFVAQTSQ